MLVYPTFIIALIGAVPTFTELYEYQSKDVGFATQKSPRCATKCGVKT